MIKLVQWLMLLFAVYVLFLLGRFYYADPRALMDLDRAGFLRLGGSIALAVGSVVLAIGIVRNWRRGNGARPDASGPAGQSEASTGGSREPPEHPFRIAFRRHPLLTGLVVAILFLVPLLLQVASEGIGRFSEYWGSVAIGEVVALVVFLASWFVAKNRTLHVNSRHESR
jgi:hypothetical protein